MDQMLGSKTEPTPSTFKKVKVGVHINCKERGSYFSSGTAYGPNVCMCVYIYIYTYFPVCIYIYIHIFKKRFIVPIGYQSNKISEAVSHGL